METIGVCRLVFEGERMKVSFVIGSISGGGAERVFCNVANSLIEKGHEVSVITVGKAKNEYNLSEKVKITCLERQKRIKLAPLRVLLKMRALKNALKSLKTDVLVVFLPKTLKAVFHYKKFVKAPIIATESSNPSIYPKNKIKYLTKCFALADGSVFLNDFAKDFYQKRISLKNPIVIPNAVNEGFDKPLFIGEREKVVLGVGRHSEVKNFPLLIDAFSIIKDEFPDHTLKIYGKGPLTQDYIEQVKRLGIEDRVIFPGFCKDIKEEVYGANAFVLSSNYEGMPVALIEAMALYTPCISTDLGGGFDLIKDGENGLIVPKGDKEALASALRKVLSDKEFSEKIAKNAGKIKEDLKPEKIYGAWEEYLLGVKK